MNIDYVALLVSTVALILYCVSYFFKTKRNYLIFQLTGNVFLAVSYLLIGSFFTMISVSIGIARGLICYAYEKKDKEVPAYMIIALCGATILSFIIVNCIILPSASVWDVLYLISSCMYAVTFAIRNIKLMRKIVLIPHALAVAYNLLINAPISSAISYGIEFVITVVAIIKFKIEERRVVKLQ